MSKTIKADLLDEPVFLDIRQVQPYKSVLTHMQHTVRTVLLEDVVDGPQRSGITGSMIKHLSKLSDALSVPDGDVTLEDADFEFLEKGIDGFIRYPSVYKAVIAALKGAVSDKS